MSTHLPIALTMGDAAGIGGEVLVKAFATEPALMAGCFVAGDLARAAAIQQQFALFPARWMGRGLTPTMKAAMQLIGLPVGGMYPPYAGLDQDEIQSLRNQLKTTVLSPRIA